MSWFIFALTATLGWGFADLFYKKGSEGDDSLSHLKTGVWVGLVMGIVAIILIPFCENLSDFKSMLTSGVKYLPASLSYIISMVIGYAGLRYLELSIVSPIQNASGALSTLVMFLFFLFNGNIKSFSEEFSPLDIIGTILIVAGVVALAIVEKKLSEESKEIGIGININENIKNKSADNNIKNVSSKYRLGVLALLFPLAYCIFDTIGTAADGIILSEESGLGLGEIDVLVLYGLTFFLMGLVMWLYMIIVKKEIYNPFTLPEIKTKGLASLFEQFGQIFYVFAMAARPMLAAPMVASYCIVSVILSRIFIKEKLKPSQYICVFIVIAGILILGISEGINS